MPTASIRVAALQPADRERWAELWASYLAFYGTSVPAAIFTSTWSRIRDPAGGIRAFGAFDDDGRLAGIAHYLFHPHAWSTRDACYLQDLFVDPAMRGRGFGRALIEAVATVARERRCHSFYWLTMTGNAAARRLYDTLALHDGTIVYDYDLRGDS